jgi:quercetin dioxygenase-like cupin family protein
MAFWTSYQDRTSDEHTHEYDEYLVCVYGQYRVIMNNEVITLNPGDELYIPCGVAHGGESIAGTRTIHAFGGKRAEREKS